MSVSPYMYAGLDSNLIDMANELQSLGGGNARIEKAEVFGIINEKIEDNTQSGRTNISVIRPLGSSIGIQDVSLTREKGPVGKKSVSVAESMHYYSVKSSALLSEAARTSGHIPPTREIAEYTLDGFNAVVLGYGQRGSGKTQSLLGYSDYSGTGESNASARQGDNSFLASYLKELYAFQESVCFNKKKYKPRSCVTIGVSVWCLLNQGTIDLCAINDVAGPNGRASLVGAEYAIVECPTLDIALQVVHSARTEVKHACSAELDETELCHMFVRVTVHQELFTASDYSGTGAHENHTGRRGEGELAGLNHELKCSQLHLVDLIGTAGAASSPHRPKEPKDLMRRREEENMIAYRGHCNALSTLAKVVSEMKQVSKESSKVSLLQAQPHIKGHAAYSASVEQMRAVNSRSIQDRSFHQSDRQHTAEVVSKLTSAREHKLTMMLAPLLQGNNKTFYVVCVRDGSANYTQSKAALGLFADVGRDVRCACFRVQDVQLHDLHMVHYQTALRVPRQVTSKEARASLSHSGGRRMGTPVELESTPQSNEEEKDEIPFIPPMPDYCLLSPYATAHYSSGEPAMQPVVVESGDHAHGPRTSRVHFDDRPQAQDVRRYRHAGPDSLANSVELGTVESAPSLLNTMLPPFNYNLSDADKSAADTVKEDDADTSISPGPTQSGASALNASSPSLMDLAMSNEFYDDGSIEAPQLDSVGADVQSVGADSTLAAAPVTSRSYVEAMNRFYEEERNQHCDAAEASSSGNLALEDKGSADMSNVSDSAALRNKWYVSATGTNSSNSHQSGAGGHSSEGLHPGMNSTAMLSSYRQLNNESQENQAGAHQVKPSRSPSASPDRPIKFNNIMSEFSQLMQSMDADGTGDGTGVGSSFVVPSVYDSRDAIQSLAQSGHKPPQENRVDANTVDAPPPPPPVGGASDGRTLPAVLCASEEYIQNKLLLQEVIGNALNVRANGGDSTKPAVASVATSVSASVESSEDVRAQIKTDMRKVSERYVFGATPPGPSPSASQLGDEDENENDYGGDDPGAADESATLEEDSLDGAYKGKGGIAGSSLDNGDFEELNVSNAAEVVDSMPPRTGTSSPAPSSSPGRGRHPRSAASSGSDDDQDTRCYLTTISNMEKTRAAMQRKIDSLQGDLAEAELRRGLERDDSQKEIRALQLQVKDLCEDFSISSVFNSYEQHIHRLVQENAELRKRNIELECGDYGAGSGPRGAGDHGDGVEPFQPPINTNNKTIYPSGRPSPPGVVSLKSTTQPAGLRGDYERPPENAFDEYVHTNAGTNSSSLDYFKKACAMLKNKLRKSGVERMQLKTEVEDLQKKARQYNVAVKLTQDSHRRLKALYFENKVVKEQLQAERSRGLVNMKDIQSLTKDNADVAAAEARLREERARILGEVALLRERLREVDAQRIQAASVSRVVKACTPAATSGGDRSNVLRHSTGMLDPSNSTPTAAYYNYNFNNANRINNTADFANANGLVGVAGLSDAKYIRLEESQTSLNPDIENALSNLHTGIAHQCPSLLPVLSQLTAHVNTDISKHIKKKAEIGEGPHVVSSQQSRVMSGQKKAAGGGILRHMSPSKVSKAASGPGQSSRSGGDPYVENIRNKGNSQGFLGIQRGAGSTAGGYASYASGYR